MTNEVLQKTTSNEQNVSSSNGLEPFPKLRFKISNKPWKRDKLGASCNVMMCKRIFAHQTRSIGDIPFFKIGTIGAIPDTYISKELFEEYKNKYNYPKINEVMITCAGTVGRCWQFDGMPSYYQDSNIVWIDNPQQKITNGFIYRILERTDWSKLNSTTITRIYNDNLKNLICFYPEIDEQQKIADFLSLVDQRIEKQRQLVESLKKYKRGLLSRIFSQHSSWNKDTADKLVHIATGSSNTQDGVANGKYPFFIRSANVARSNKYIFDGEAVLTIGDGQIGKVFHYVNGKFDCHQRVYMITDFRKISGRYFYHFFSTFFYERAIKMSAKNTVDSVRMEMIAKMPIYYPSQEQQNKIVSSLDALDSKIVNEHLKQEKLELIKKGLLQQMFI